MSNNNKSNNNKSNSTVTIDTLREVVNITNGNERRAQLRKMFGAVIGPHLKDCDWANIGRRSPLVGDGPDQFNLRPTWSEYRDRCSVHLMAYMILAALETNGTIIVINKLVECFIEAITYPEINGVVKDEMRMRADRFWFGQFKEWEIDYTWNNLLNNVTQPKPSNKKTKPVKQEKKIMGQDTDWVISNEKKDRELLDSVLRQVTENEVSVERIEKAINGGLAAQKENADLKRQLKAKPQAESVPVATPEGVPDLNKVTWKNANKVFREGQKKIKALDFEIPTFEWNGVHGDVPEEDSNYIFRTHLLVPTLLALVENTKAWITGHTGTGKSTLVKQIAARLQWPVITLSLDGEITRMDLIGRDSLTTDEKGNTVSKFIEGVLPRAFNQPCILLCDEIDFVRDDIAYTLQTALNENEVTITEDGGRVVRASPWSRIMATANTLGQGDDSGLYRGAKVQSQAFLDRFTTWIEVPYMDEQDERNLLVANSAIEPEVMDKVLQYAKEHREGFVNATILQPLSPRGLLALVSKYGTYQGLFSTTTDALRQAINETLLNRANGEDRIVLEGIINRVFGV